MTTSWRDVRVSSWDEFEQAVRRQRDYGHGPNRGFAFRGQPNVMWKLEPTLARLMAEYRALARRAPNSTASYFLKAQLQQFKTKAHLSVNLTDLVVNSSATDWLVLARHYGMASPLLDWSFSPYVAAWLAVDGHWSSDGVVWAAPIMHINAQSSPDKDDGLRALMFGASELLDQLSNLEIIDSPARLLFFVPRAHNVRSAIQQGLFSICSDPVGDHAIAIQQLLDRVGLADEILPTRFVIEHSAKREFARILRRMNIHAESLLPGLDGLCKSLNDALLDHTFEDEEWRQRAMVSLTADIRGTSRMYINAPRTTDETK